MSYLERAFEQHGIWDAFMTVKAAEAVGNEIVRSRDEDEESDGRFELKYGQFRCWRYC